jgi:sugar phosphate permease
MVSTTAMAFAAGGYQAWLLDFLQEAKGLSEESATQILGLAILGGLAGVLTGGRLADHLRRRITFGRPATIALGMACTVPCALLCIYAPPGPALAIGAVATMFFVSWYHGPMAATVDDLAPDGGAVTTQALVISSMHLFGTAPASWVVGRIKDATDFTTAMLVPTAVVGLASLAMTRAFSSFEADAAGSTRRGGGAITAIDA